jgi:hypothetical protein
MEDFIDAATDQMVDVESQEVALVEAGPDQSEQFHQLEEQSYHFALIAGDAELNMWLALKQIRDSELWKLSEAHTLDEYLQGWMLEVRNRAAAAAKANGQAMPALPMSLSLAQKKLAIGRRLVDFFECPPEKVLTAPLNVMGTFMTTLASSWDYKQGFPKNVQPAAAVGLDKKFPDAPDFKTQVRAAVEVITSLPPGEALEYIKDNFTEPSVVPSYDFRVVVFKGQPFLRCRIRQANVESGELGPEVWYDWSAADGWPDDAIAALCKRLGAGEPKYPEVPEEALAEDVAEESDNADADLLE